MLALAPFKRVRALADGLEIAHPAGAQDFRQALIAAADEGLHQLALEVEVAAGQFAQRDHVDFGRRGIGLQVAAEAIDQLRGLDGLAEMRVHAGGNAVLAILAHDIGGERNDGQALEPPWRAPVRGCAASR